VSVVCRDVEHLQQSGMGRVVVFVFSIQGFVLHHQVTDLNGVIGLSLIFVFLNAKRSMGASGLLE
jgi:hypothetical protein